MDGYRTETIKSEVGAVGEAIFGNSLYEKYIPIFHILLHQLHLLHKGVKT
jgi:hypothetical protein